MNHPTNTIRNFTSDKRIVDNQKDIFLESSSSQEEKKEAGSSCDESITKRSNSQHSKLPRHEKYDTDSPRGPPRRDSAATVSSESSSSSGSVAPRTPQHQIRDVRTFDDRNVNELSVQSLFTTSDRDRGNNSHLLCHSSKITANASDDALERYASRIRQELHHKEMMELAEAAERAAEAGEESFAVRPSTFGTNEWSNAMDDSILKTPTTSAVTRTHGLTPLLIRKRVEKIGVTELRDVHEVFPDFGEFHTHLRTHLVRKGVDRKATIFKEKLKADAGLNFFRDLNDWMSPSTDAALEQKHSQNSCISAWDIGNILGEHMDLSGSKTQAAGSSRHQVEEECSARQPIAIDAHPRLIKYENHKVHSPTRRTLRRALFDDDEGDFPRSLPETQTLQDTQTSNKQQAPNMYSSTQDTRKSMKDFVTPVRLRDIRRLSDTDDRFDGFMSPSSLLDSPVYMVRENEEQREQIGTALHNSRASLSSIMLPSLASTHSVDMRVEKIDARMMEGSQPCKAVEDSRDEASEDMPLSGFPILGPLLLDGMTPLTSRESIRLEEIEPQSNEGLLNLKLVSVHQEPSNQHCTSSIQTPLQDECGCLGIPTNSSLDSNEPSSLSPQGEERSLSTRVNPLASLISRMSPSSSVFHSMKNNRLYFRSKANDAFLNNYLYCSKSVERCHKEPLSLFSKACHETPSSCMDLNVNSCCTAILPDTFSDVPNMKPTKNNAPQHSFVSLGGASSLKSKAELWFDRATENFDHFLEKLSGAPSTSSARNISFQAPTLNKKIVPAPHADLPPSSPVSAVSDIETVLDLDSISLKEMDLSTNK